MVRKRNVLGAIVAALLVVALLLMAPALILGAVLWGRAKSEDAKRAVELAVEQQQDVAKRLDLFMEEVGQIIRFVDQYPATVRGREFKQQFLERSDYFRKTVPPVRAAESVEESKEQCERVLTWITTVRRELETERDSYVSLIREDLSKTLVECVMKHASILARKRKQLVRRDEFGKDHHDRWHDYLKGYLVHQVEIEEASAKEPFFYERVDTLLVPV